MFDPETDTLLILGGLALIAMLAIIRVLEAAFGFSPPIEIPNPLSFVKGRFAKKQTNKGVSPDTDDLRLCFCHCRCCCTCRPSTPSTAP